MGPPRDPLARLRERLRRGEAIVAGVLSGTSGDGIDVVLVRFPAAQERVGLPRTLDFSTEPFPTALAPRVRAALDGAPAGAGALAALSRDLGRAFGGAARAVAARAGVRLDLVGSHGQTVFHHDGAPEHGRATLQLGEPAFVSAAAGAPVVADFRQADLAAGGEGAPLSALVDGLLFSNAPRPLAVLNLGGMANLTLLPAEAELLAFDTGPAGSLLDGLARRLLDAPYDDGGASAARGRVDDSALNELLADPFFERRPPKSTGRDTFGEAWVDEVAARVARRVAGTGAADALATAVALVAHSVALALERFAPEPPRALVLAGGGARNRALVAALARATGLETVSASRHGVDPDAREALVFAVLAARALLGEPSTQRGATGARPGCVLGAITPFATAAEAPAGPAGPPSG